jgi:hypothetical protein
MRSISGNSKGGGGGGTRGSIHLQNNVRLRLPDSREANLRGFPKLSSAIPQVIHARELPLFTERIREHERAALAMESGAEGFLENYGFY